MNLLFLKYVDRTLGRWLEGGLAVAGSIQNLAREGWSRLEVRRIVVLKLWGIGNIAMILPILERIKERYPEASLSFVTLESNRALLEDHPCLDTVYSVNLTSLPAMASSCVRILRSLRARGVDVLLDMEQFSRLSGAFGRLAGARQVVGLYSPEVKRGRLAHVQVPLNPHQHMRLTFADVARAIGVDPPPLAGCGVRPSDEGLREFEEATRGWATARDVLVGFHVGSSDNFPGKRWPRERFAAVADALVERYGAKVFFTGSGAEARLVGEATHLMRHPACTLVGRLSVKGLVAAIARSRLFFSNDTAPVHIASALNVPVVAFYGPATPQVYGPTSEGSLVFYKALPCSPCITHFNAKTSFCRLPVCMESITVEEVVETVHAHYGAMLRVPQGTRATPGGRA